MKATIVSRGMSLNGASRSQTEIEVVEAGDVA